MDSNPADSTKPPPSLSDPNLVNTLVEELKSKGIFDQIRNDALAEVDTKVNKYLQTVFLAVLQSLSYLHLHEFSC